MANEHTRFTDVIEPEIYMNYTAVDNPEKSELVDSGVVLKDSMFDDIINNQASELPNIPFWNDLDPTVEPNYSDDSDTSATPGKVTASKMIARVCYLNQSYKDADLVRQRIKSDPMQQIRNRFGTYWKRQFQRRVTASLMGVLADNVANDSSDMVNDVHGALNSDVTSSTLFSKSAFINAAFTMGDRFDETSVIYMHSIVYARLLDQNGAEDVRNSDGALLYRSYMGHRVIVDDSDLLVTAAEGASAGDDAAIYRSIILAPGAIAYGEGFPDIPVEVHREPLQGKGGGTEAIIERVNWLIHPFGYQWKESSIGLYSPTLAELAEAAQWDRVVARKNVPIAYLITNG